MKYHRVYVVIPLLSATCLITAPAAYMIRCMCGKVGEGKTLKKMKMNKEYDSVQRKMVSSKETQFCLLEITGGRTTEEQEARGAAAKTITGGPTTQCVWGGLCTAQEKKNLIYYLVLFLPLSAGVKVHGSAQRATYIINELHRPARQFHCCKRQSIRSCSRVAGVNTEEDTWKEHVLLFWCECNTIIFHLY